MKMNRMTIRSSRKLWLSAPRRGMIWESSLVRDVIRRRKGASIGILRMEAAIAERLRCRTSIRSCRARRMANVCKFRLVVIWKEKIWAIKTVKISVQPNWRVTIIPRKRWERMLKSTRKRKKDRRKSRSCNTWLRPKPRRYAHKHKIKLFTKNPNSESQVQT